MIIFQFDNAYYDWGLLVLQSLQLHEPDTQVLCDTVNLSDHQIAELQQAHARLIVTNDTTTWSETSPAQMAARKPFVMQRAMQQFPEQPWFGLLDTDFLVRKPLKRLWALLENHAAALFMTDGMWEGKFYRRLLTPSGIVLVRRDARRLIDCWAKWYYHDQPLESIKPQAWFWDQITLTEARTEVGGRYAPIPMDLYGDCSLRSEAAIWSAHVGALKDWYYYLFRREYLRQRAELTGQEAASGQYAVSSAQVRSRSMPYITP